MAKTFTIAGTSHHKGETAYRFANKKLSVRLGVLKRDGHTKINLIELPSAMTKDEAVAHLATLGIVSKMPKGRQSKAAMEKAAAAAAKREAANERRKAQRAAAKQVVVKPENVINVPTQEQEDAANEYLQITHPATDEEPA